MHIHTHTHYENPCNKPQGSDYITWILIENWSVIPKTHFSGIHQGG